jgi:hypothetical protein
MYCEQKAFQRVPFFPHAERIPAADLGAAEDERARRLNERDRVRAATHPPMIKQAI